MSKEEYLVLQRVSWRKKPRTDWPARWFAAVRACDGKGVYQPTKDEPYVMAATRKSPVWKKLASGAGGFRDAIGIGEPPFAFGSGLGWRPFSQEKGKKRDIVLSEKSSEVRRLRKENSSSEIGEENLADALSKEFRKILPKEIKFEIKV